EFVCGAVDAPLMGHEVDASYDVRGWGDTYGLTYLLLMKSMELLPDELGDAAEAAIKFYLDGIAATEIPRSGGWNYARRGGFDKPGPHAPFMTAPTLQALFFAMDEGYGVDRELVERGLSALTRSRTDAGSVVYAGSARARSDQSTPGAVGRMLVSEATLFLAGRSDESRLRGALDAFLAHWQWLERRRARPGTHEGPYGVAPYYFFFAHYYAAQAIELLPESARPEYRTRLREILMGIRSDEGSWNDRVFSRSANYGTAMALMALIMPDLQRPARWHPE
ncbi:MAG: prenyltransferase/squalene oxidase repeat-containing protein, partial [Planctomycetota bacterium]